MTDRFATMSDYDVWTTIVGNQTVNEFLDGSPDDTEAMPVIEAYLNGSPMCDDLNEAERSTVGMKLARYCARG